MFRNRKPWRRIGEVGPAADTADLAASGRDGQRTAPFVDDASLRETGYACVDLIVEYLQGLEGRRVYGPVSPAGMDDLFDEPLPLEGCSLAEIIQACRTKVFPNTMAIGSRRYFGMMNPAPLPISVFADALCAAMNQNVASWRHAPAGTAIEKRVIRWLCELFGLGERGFGTFVPGGSLANITGLKLAINKATGRNLSQVTRLESHPKGQARLRFYVSCQAHYSFDKAIDLMGLGRGQLRKIPEDNLFRVDLDLLEHAIQRDLDAGLRPCCIIGIAGTTNTGSVDKLDRLAELARAYGCWFHVDAAYGGAVILSETYAPMLRGIEQADSIAVDPHKWFYIPFEAGAILVREGDFLRRSFLVHPEYYMEWARQQDGASEASQQRAVAEPDNAVQEHGQGRPHPHEPHSGRGEGSGTTSGGRSTGSSGSSAEGDPGESAGSDPSDSTLVLPDQRSFHMGDKVNFFQYGVAGSRRFNALKVWLAFKMIGRRKYAAWVEKDIELARLLATMLRRQRDFKLIGPNTLGVCNVRWDPLGPDGNPLFGGDDVDQLNRELQELIEQEGDAWFSHTVLKGQVALRVNVENRSMDRRDIERLVQVLKRAAGRILQSRQAASDRGVLPGGTS